MSPAGGVNSVPQHRSRERASFRQPADSKRRSPHACGRAVGRNASERQCKQDRHDEYRHDNHTKADHEKRRNNRPEHRSSGFETGRLVPARRQVALVVIVGKLLVVSNARSAVAVSYVSIRAFVLIWTERRLRCRHMLLVELEPAAFRRVERSALELPCDEPRVVDGRCRIQQRKFPAFAFGQSREPGTGAVEVSETFARGGNGCVSLQESQRRHYSCSAVPVHLPFEIMRVGGAFLPIILGAEASCPSGEQPHQLSLS